MKWTLLFALCWVASVALGQSHLPYARQVADSITRYENPQETVDFVLYLRDAAKNTIQSKVSEWQRLSEQYAEQVRLTNQYLSQLGFETVPIDSTPLPNPPPDPNPNPTPPPSGSYGIYSPAYTDFQTCEDWVRFRLGEFELENNTWGRGNAVSLEACMFADASEKKWGARWNSVSNVNNVLSYQQIIWWGKPWHRYQLRDEPFPKIEDVEHFAFNFSVDLKSTGKHNVAAELWTYNSLKKNSDGGLENNIVNEIMIWQVETERFGNSEVGNVVIDGREYRLSMNSSGSYIAFLPVNNHTSGKIDVKAFLDYLVSMGRVNPEHYISGLELGVEVINGSGEATFNDFNIEFQRKGVAQVRTFRLFGQKKSNDPPPKFSYVDKAERKAIAAHLEERRKTLRR